jgi:hypothetical protein
MNIINVAKQLLKVIIKKLKQPEKNHIISFIIILIDLQFNEGN